MPAALSGLLQTGDVLTMANGMALRTTNRARAAELLAAAGERIQLSVAGTVPVHVLNALLSEHTHDLGPYAPDVHDRMLTWSGRVLRFLPVAVIFFFLFFIGILEGVLRFLCGPVVRHFVANGSEPSSDNWCFDLAMWFW